MCPLKRFSIRCALCVAAAVPSVASAVFVEFEAGGANPAAIQGTVDAFRAALGNPNNGNAAGPLSTGRREINWDGGDPTNVTTTQSATPFGAFLNRGALITTPGTGVVQAPPVGPAPGGGLAGVFGNPTYGTTFTTFSPSRLFTPIGSNITDITFFVPSGTANVSSNIRAAVSGFGAVFSDVDPGGGSALTFFDIDNNILFSDTTIEPGALSFVGAVDPNARIARVRIVTGNTALRRPMAVA